MRFAAYPTANPSPYPPTDPSPYPPTDPTPYPPTYTASYAPSDIASDTRADSTADANDRSNCAEDRCVMDPTTGLIAEFLKQGAFALVIVGLLVGWLVPKWVVDEMRTRLQLKDDIIERQSALIEKMAAKAAAVPVAHLKTGHSRTPDDDA